MRSRRHPHPVVDLTLLSIPSFRQGTVGTLIFAAAFFSMILGNILFLTSVWGYSVLDAGLAVAPGPLASAIVAGPAGKLADRFGHRAVIVPGTLVYAGGLLILRSAGLEPDYVGTWLPGQLLIGVGIGLAFPTLGAAAAADIAPERFGVASAMTSAGRQLGAVLGTALLIAIVGEPQTVRAAADVADDAYVFGIAAALASGLAVVRLTPGRHHGEHIAARAEGGGPAAQPLSSNSPA